MLKVFTEPPAVWVANFKLKEALKDNRIDVSFSKEAKKMTVKLVKPRKRKC